MQAHEIVKQIHDAFPGLPQKLEMITGKSAEWWNSHHREPKSRNPLQTGNVSPVTHYIEYVHQNEAAKPGSGHMMNNRVHAALNADFIADDLVTETELQIDTINEVADVHRWFAEFDFDDATPNQLATFERDCGDVIDAMHANIAKARAVRRQIEAGLTVRDFATGAVAARRSR